MTHKFDPANKEKLDNDERRAFYDLPQLLKYFSFSRGMVIADVGCGTGYFTFPLATITGNTGKVFALDISEEMLETVKDKVKRWNTDNVIPLLSQESAFPIEDNAVDFIMLSHLVHELESPLTFFSEVERVLKKGGSIGIVDWDSVDSPVGPPLKERISRDEMKGLLEKSGYAIDKDKQLGKYHYAILAGRPEDILAKKIKKVSEKLVQELLCIKEKTMRSAILAERFNGSKEEVVVEILNALCKRASEKKKNYVEIMASCMDIDRFKRVLGLEKMSKIYNIAREKEYTDVVRLLMNPPPKGLSASEYDFVEGRDIFDITLGEKRSLSKTQLKDTLDRLLYDEDPTVIKNLLANPRVTERDVLKVVSKRPNTPEVMKAIFESTKWSSRYIIKRALVLNPYTPTGMALGLINFMQYKDLKMIAGDNSLHKEVSEAAGELLKKNYRE
ncbi:MAG: class I SAM-dependent methyltransferase [Proteobacteria bacterium]|nr:class I SAM-dependent methyltransferase [Pseudomonadota bacterium]